MGVQKNLVQAKQDLEKVKPLILKPDVNGAKAAITKIKTLLTTTATAAAEKQKKSEETIRKFAEAVNTCLAICDKKPFEGKKAETAITTATTAAVAAVTAVDPAKG